MQPLHDGVMIRIMHFRTHSTLATDVIVHDDGDVSLALQRE